MSHTTVMVYMLLYYQEYSLAIVNTPQNTIAVNGLQQMVFFPV